MPVFVGLCHVRGGDVDSQLPAAVVCADASGREYHLRAELSVAGYQLVRLEDVLPAEQWIARHPAPDVAALVRVALETQRVALGQPLQIATAQHCLRSHGSGRPAGRAV
jgi:hypothetical protein